MTKRRLSALAGAFALGLIAGPLLLYFLVLPFPLRNALYLEYQPTGFPGIVGDQNFRHGNRFGTNEAGEDLPAGTLYLASTAPYAAHALQEAIETICVVQADPLGRDVPPTIHFEITFSSATQQAFQDVLHQTPDRPWALMMGGHRMGTMRYRKPDEEAGYTPDPFGDTYKSRAVFSRENLGDLVQFLQELGPTDPFTICDFPFADFDTTEMAHPDTVAAFKGWAAAQDEAVVAVRWWKTAF